jgi:hypothetical protein
MTTELVISEPADFAPPSSLTEAAERVDSLLREGNRTALGYAWQVGQVIAAVQEDEGIYGTRAVDRLAEQVGKTPRLLQEMLRFYRAFPDSGEVAEMAIEWSSAREVLRLPDEKNRAEVIEEAESANLSVRQVRELVNKAVADAPAANAPRVRALSAKGWFRKMLKMLESDLGRVKAHMQKYPEAAHIAADSDKTSDDDYDTIVYGDCENEALIAQISEEATRLASYLQTQVTPIRNAFEEPAIEDAP